MIEECIHHIGKSGKVKVEIEWMGEGWDGEYDSTNPDDTPFMRFSVSKLADDGIWEPIDDSSYCTLLPATIDMDTAMNAAKHIMQAVEDRVIVNLSIKKVCEQLSWIKPEWFKKPDEEDIS